MQNALCITILFFIIIFALAGCADTNTLNITITPQTYSKEFNKQMKQELSGLPLEPCARDIEHYNKDCSAVRRALMDYHDEREKLKKANN